ncbi:MAG: hypothetical protein ABI162_06965 [Luteolibacter sp.]
MKKLLGKYVIGYEVIEVYTDTDRDGGLFYLPDGRNDLGQMVIGLDGPSWPLVLSTLIHEAIEYAAVRQHTRFEPSMDTSKSTGAYRFFMTHEEFTEVLAVATELIAETQLPIARRYRAQQLALKNKWIHQQSLARRRSKALKSARDGSVRKTKRTRARPTKAKCSTPPLKPGTLPA